MIYLPALSPATCLPHCSIIPRVDRDKVCRIAKNAFTQASLSIAVNCAFRVTYGAFFMPQTVVLFTSLVSAGLVVLSIKGIWDRCYPKKTTESSKIDLFVSKIARLSIVNTLTLKLNHYIHEYGHALAAISTFLEAKPEIFANLREGRTSYVVSNGLTRFGKLMGEERSKLFVAAAGPFIAVACGMTEIIFSKFLGENHPLISELLNDHGFAQIVETILYGMSTFVTSKMNLGHDFMYLWQYGGIHPTIPLTLLFLSLGAGIVFTAQNKKIPHQSPCRND